MSETSTAAWNALLRSTEEADRRIRDEIRNSVLRCAAQPEEIERRLDELECEWNLERTLQAHAGAAVLGGMLLGAVSRKWRVLALLAGGFLIAHALGAWCPAAMFWRNRGVHTAGEIALERCALRALRGDFDAVKGDQPPRERALRALEAVGLVEG